MASIFSKIVSGEIPAYIVAESDDFLAFLDVNPVCYGHVLVIPKVETDYIFDLSDTDLAGLMTFAKIVAKRLKKVVDCKRIGISVVGLEVPHAHVHLMPINNITDMDFGKPRLSLSKDEFKVLAEKIINAI